MTGASDDVERRRDGRARCQKALLDPLLPDERVIDAGLRQPAVFGGANDGLDRRPPVRSTVVLQSRPMSQPAEIAASSTSAGGTNDVAPFMPRSSVMTSPSKRRCSFRKPVTMPRENVAGARASSAGTSTCAVMIAATPSATARLNGTNSTASSRRAIVFDHGQGLVRIDGGVAVAGKVLAARGHAVLL